MHSVCRTVVCDSRCVWTPDKATTTVAFHTECRAHVPSWLPRSPSCQLASECLATHVLPRRHPQEQTDRGPPFLTRALFEFLCTQCLLVAIISHCTGVSTDTFPPLVCHLSFFCLLHLPIDIQSWLVPSATSDLALALSQCSTSTFTLEWILRELTLV
jgi:hypothetical protein